MRGSSRKRQGQSENRAKPTRAPPAVQVTACDALGVSPAAWSLLALALTIVLSCWNRVNAGVVALVLAWAVGAGPGGLSVREVGAGFPSSLFLTLVGVTLLFSLAETNGSLELAARRLLFRAATPHLLPPALFVAAGLLAAMGPGAIPPVALLAPIGMAIAVRAGISPLAVALAVCLGANAANLSPLAAGGVIARDGMAKAGLHGVETKTFLANFLAHLLVGLVAWAWFARRSSRARSSQPATLDSSAQVPAPAARTTWQQRFTLVVLALWMLATLFAGVPVGFAALFAAVLLVIVGAADERAAMRALPWGVIVMVTGVSTLVAVLERTGGIDLFADLVARISSPQTVYGVVALLTGIVSTFSSTSGVVLPAFLPMSAELVERLGGGDPLAVALAIDVGSSLVDVSPVSTLGALCVAALGESAESRRLFRQLLLFGFSMAVVGALLAVLFAGPFARL